MQKQIGKLTLSRYKVTDPEKGTGTASQPIELRINPDSFNITYNQGSKNGGKVTVTNEPVQTVLQFNEEELSMDIYFDGTGAVPGSLDIATQIANFKGHTLSGSTPNEINYVQLQWGGAKGLNFIGQLTSLTLNYTLFDLAGDPLRAKASVSFVSRIREGFKSTGRADNSKTTIHVFKAGDSLPGVCYKMYGDPTYYPQVAAANKLSSPTDVRPGDRLVMPPKNQLRS